MEELIPRTAQGFYQSVAGIAITYVLLSYVIYSIRKRRPKIPAVINFAFNGGTFSVSLMLMVGIFDKELMKLIGDTTLFLVLAGILGVIIPLHNMLFFDDDDDDDRED